MGLIVDQVRRGAGTTNDGNTARRAFADTAKLSEITGLDRGLIDRFAVVLAAINTQQQVDPEKFETFAMDTARLYTALYGWYRMPPSVHRVLVHGAAVMRQLPLSVGTYSEEPQESRQKHNKQYRAGHASKVCRQDTMRDQFNYLLVSSDPVCGSFRKSYNGRGGEHSASPQRSGQLRTSVAC